MTKACTSAELARLKGKKGKKKPLNPTAQKLLTAIANECFIMNSRDAANALAVTPAKGAGALRILIKRGLIRRSATLVSQDGAAYEVVK